ncbi:SPOR domain-containing protein [Luteimonas sp. A482]
MPSRALIVLLLILNLGVTLWWITRVDTQPAPVVALPEGAEPLRLLDEAASPAIAAVPMVAPVPTPAPAPAAAVPSVVDVDADAAVATVCRSFGPFDEATAAQQAQARLRPLVQSLATRQVQPTARGWQVRMRALPDRAAAAATATRLAAAGFRDHYLMPADADGWVDIALGRFGSEPAARRHQQALVAAGFGAIAEPLGDPATARHWIDVAAPVGADLAALQRASGAARSEAVECATLPR